MIDIKEFRTIQLQAVIFTPGIKFQSGRALGVLLSGWADIFSKIIFSADLPLGAPEEVPRTIVQSEDLTLKAHIAPLRLDLFWNAQKETDLLDIASQLETFSAIFSKYKETMSCRVARIACIISRVAPNSNPGRFLAQHFFNERMIGTGGPLVNPEFSVLEFTAYLKYPLEGWEVAHLVKFKSAQLILAGNAQSIPPSGPFVIGVDQDLSTLPENLDVNTISSGSISKFFRSTPSEFDARLNDIIGGSQQQ